MGARMKMDFHALPTPCYVVDRELLKRNLVLLRSVMDRTGCRILLAQKAFSMFSLYPMIGQYLSCLLYTSPSSNKRNVQGVAGKLVYETPALNEGGSFIRRRCG